MNTRDIALIGLFTALTAAGSFIKIPLGFTPVPATLQVFFVIFAGLMLGPVRGAISQAAYVLIGAAGLPVFAGGTGGFQSITGPTGGYLYGFIVAAFVIGLLVKLIKTDNKSLKITGAFLAGIVGVIVIYFFGAFHMILVLKLSVAKAIALGVAPFIVIDIMKAILASTIFAAIQERGVLPALES